MFSNTPEHLSICHWLINKVNIFCSLYILCSYLHNSHTTDGKKRLFIKIDNNNDKYLIVLAIQVEQS